MDGAEYPTNAVDPKPWPLVFEIEWPLSDAEVAEEVTILQEGEEQRLKKTPPEQVIDPEQSLEPGQGTTHNHLTSLFLQTYEIKHSLPLPPHESYGSKKRRGLKLREKIKKILQKGFDELIETILNVVEEDGEEEEVMAEEEEHEALAADDGLIEAEEGIKAEKGTMPIKDDLLIEAEDDEMVAIEEIDLFLCKITRDFVPENLTTIMMNGMESYDELAASIHLAWSEKAQEEFDEVLPDISNCWPEGYLEFVNMEGKKL
ncbi:hypothetical protein RHGRI_025149 [Rhododendron griersonianum]|uniref:Uncharacterized protein n=1 Tax=Rhododendron griersonianum TaxID=479676 RepID=A0AAV6JA69_9ERIC|nr:hypothetical protein RHGRI_025149 [Rhododendron griersonianum]